MMYKNEGGMLALYRGIIPTVAGVAPYVSGIISLKAPALLWVQLTNAGWAELHGLRICSYLPHA